MLSKTERAYLTSIEQFEDAHVFYGKVVRSRIRKKAEQAILDLMLVIEKDRSGREPVKEWRKRKAVRILKRFNEKQKQDPSTDDDQGLVGANALLMFNRTWRGKRESSMIIPIQILDLVQSYVKRHLWLGERLIEKIKGVKKEAQDEERAAMLKEYREHWSKYGDDWLEQHFDANEDECTDAGFEGKTDCIAWLKEHLHPLPT